jgi:murein DD-endopeptidase MepM/ murein hydrolase activator NlpD
VPPAQQAGAAPAPAVPAGPTVTVREGDTIYGIAQRYGVPLRDLIEANDLSPPFDVRAGRVLRLPTAREHIVQSTDTLSQIAERHGMTTAELAALNDIEPPYAIYVGQALRLPGPPASDAPATIAAAEPGDPATVGEPVRLAPNPGGVDREALAPLEPIEPAEAGEAAEIAEPAERLVLREPEAAEPPEAAEAPTSLAAAPPPRPVEEPAFSLDESPRRAGLPAEVAPPPRTGSLFQWPIRGEILAGFGETTESGRNEGINIAAPRGTPIRAAEAGVVAYAGNELRGYGNLVLIRHADGWVTAYAHTDAILVERGQEVAAGQEVATVGDTGAVSGPQLHFEIRQGSDSVDPLDYLP